ncbi:flavin monoamine oxidase family protein [Kitasatospora sp. LaBMicrA B282]|uniref:flavin monoamine oxidase family protein n=1 Tax=Kitasatospora sp. LaBMicrA B282 TaxID=3420949 RepID=UPI003D0C40FA
MRPARRVTVIGAGVAGLVAAWELERLGYRVTVLEADRRIGGRILTHRFGSGPGAPLVELGAMRIPDHHRLTLEYLDLLQLSERLTEFRTLFAEGNAVLATGAGFVRVKDAAEPLISDFRRRLTEPADGAGPPAPPYSASTIAVGAWLTAVVEAVAPPELRAELAADLRDQLLGLVEQLAVPGHPLRADGRVDLHALFAAHPDLRAGCSPRLNSFLDDILVETGPTLLRLRGGMDQLTDRLAGRLRRPVVLGREVVRIEVREREVLVHARSAGPHPDVHRADFAVCTVPFPALRRIAMTGLDADKRAVLDEVDYCPATKVALHCREPFWQHAGITGGASFTAGGIRQTYYPPAEETADPLADAGAALLASYTLGAEAEHLGRLPGALRHRRVLTELAAVHPELLRPGMVLGCASAAWGQSPWAGGCATRWGQDAASCERERARAARPVHRLFFAGEHCSTAPAWIEGAIESARQTVAELAAFPGGGRSRGGRAGGRQAGGGRAGAAG